MATKDVIDLKRKVVELLPNSIFHGTFRPVIKWRRPSCLNFQGGVNARNSRRFPVKPSRTKNKTFVRDLTAGRVTDRKNNTSKRQNHKQ
jgi:hypothetical protein